MDFERMKKLSSLRASIGTFSDFSQNEDSDEIEDPISAYFKQRCRKASKGCFKKHHDSDSDSSIGLIDVDNVSLFGDGEGSENFSLRLSENLLDQLNRDSLNVKKSKDSEVQKVSTSQVESELDKQRALAQKALKKLNDKTEDSQYDISVVMPKKRESKALADISSKLMNVKLSMGKSEEKEWFEPNFSPNTPRYFNDELSSFGGEDENMSVKSDAKDFETERFNRNRQSHYAKKVNSMLKDLAEIPVSSDMEFESQTKEEQINRFEEDEKKFKLENSALLHNSQISQFSGIDGGDISQWAAETSNSKPEVGTKNLSIGQFFNLRSNRVSSLVGSAADENGIPNLEEEAEASTLTDAQMQALSKSEYSLPISELTQPEKPKFRRCVSTLDLKRISEVAKSMRYSSVSNASCTSNSTVMIQDILAEMESGLSGTQIYEKLMKSYGRKEKEGGERKNAEKKQTFKKTVENNETPKSSKEPKRKEMVRSNKKVAIANEFQKDTKIHNSVKEIKEKLERSVKLSEMVASPKSEKLKKAGTNKGFFSSTPKTQGTKSQNEKHKTGYGKVLMNEDEWVAPRAISIQSIDLNKSEGSEENDKTVTVSSSASSELNKKNSTIVINDTFTIEDTIVAGDLTVLSQRIEEMKRDSVCIVRSDEPEEPLLLAVIQKLADLPKGSLDCSALMPLIRDQFPELLSDFPTPSENSSVKAPPKLNLKAQDSLVALPGAWVKLPGIWGLKEKIHACADLEKTVHVPLVNISQNWLLVSIESMDLIHPQGKKLPGVRKNNEWFVLGFVTVTFKETIISPDNRQSLKIFFKSKLALKLELMLTFSIKELMNGEVQTRSLRLLINNVHPENYINVLPKDPINFGTIADQCSDQATVQVSFDGITELPLTIYIEEDETISKHFILKPCAGHQHEKEWDDNIYQHVFYEGEKQVLEFRVVFQPNILLKEDSKPQDFKAVLILMLGNKTDTDGILRKIPIKGSVGFAKFLCGPNCNLLVFRVSEKGQSVTRPYPLKNVGSLPVALSVSITNEERQVVEGEDVFVVPKSFYLARSEEAVINVTFNSRNALENFTKRFLKLRIQPNGRVVYEAELIGIVTSMECRPVSRTSGASVSTKSATNSESVPIKLLTTTHSLSWAAVSLEKESRQTFQIKSLSCATVAVRLSFERNLDAFKLVSDNGEKVHRMRKVLKPDCPYVLTVAFRPDVLGAHNNALLFETTHSSQKKKILLNGIGGIPNLLMRNVKSDLNGSKILRLQYSHATNQFENEIKFSNEGRIPAFLLIKTGLKDFSLSHDIMITPSSVIVSPDSSVTVKISQKLKHDDLHQLLSDREIRKIATVCVLTGDEPSRQRIKKLVTEEKLQLSERLKLFTDPFQDEKEIQLKNFRDSMGFEMEFLKSLKVHEIAVVVERGTEIYEPSILEETTDEFISFMSEKTVISAANSQRPSTSAESCSGVQKSTCSGPLDINASLFSSGLLKSIPSHNKITKWLETLDCP